MTTAICLRCGAAKDGPFSPCARCSYDPAREADKRIQAKCLWLSGQHHSSEQLDALSERIHSGKSVAFDEKAIDALVGQLGTLTFPAIVKASTGWSLMTWSLIGLGVGLGVGVVVLVALMRMR
jgi:hypothetical protein